MQKSTTGVTDGAESESSSDESSGSEKASQRFASEKAEEEIPVAAAETHKKKRASQIIDVAIDHEHPPEVEVSTAFVDSPLFNNFILAGIAANALQMGMEVQYEDGAWLTAWGILEHFFTAFFLIELCIKLPLMGKAYFETKANWLDFGVVVVAILDNWILKFVMTGGSDIGFISILRLVRLSRMLKLLKAKRELMMLIEGILTSIRSMFWLSILLSILIYIVSIVFVKFIGRSGAYENSDLDIDKYFGDMLKAGVTSLNLAMMNDWGVIFRPILQQQPIFAFALCVYVGIASFGIMNAIIGVIVTSTGQAAAEAAAEDQLCHRTLQMQFVDEIKEIIYEIDTDGDGTVCPEEIMKASDNEDLLEALREVDLPPGFSMLELHCMLDKDGDGELTKDEFAQGMKRLIFSDDFQRSCLLSLAVAQVKRKLYQLRSDLTEDMRDHFVNVNKRLDKMPQLLAEVLSSHGFSPGGSGPGSPPLGASSPPGSPTLGARSPQSQKDAGSILAKKTDLKAEDLPGYIGDTVGINNQKVLALSQKSQSQPGARPPSVQQVLQNAGTVAGATAQVSQAVFLEVSKALSTAARNWSQEDHNSQPFPLAHMMPGGNPYGQGGLRQAGQSGGFNQQGMMTNQITPQMNPQSNQMPQINPMMVQNQHGGGMMNQQHGGMSNQFGGMQAGQNQGHIPGARPATGQVPQAGMNRQMTHDMGNRPQTSPPMQGQPPPVRTAANAHSSVH